MFRLMLVAWLAAAPLQEIPPVPGEASPAGEVDAVSFHLLKYVDRVERDGTFVRTGDFQVRLRTEEGVAAFGQIGEVYLDGYGDVHFEDVLIEKVDGRRMAVADALEEDLTPVGVTTTSMPPDVRYKKIAIPGLEPGDRLSYRIVHRRKPLAPGRAFGELKLAPATGAPKQVYELDLPRDAGFKVRLRQGIGTEWEEVPSAPDRWVRRLSLTVASLDLSKKSKEEAERLAEPDVIFTSFDSWDEVAGWWWGIS
ncbi:MAG TPA: DUF3857 domain-containing protein, partial [Vicinamibacteria bacterium]